MEGYRTWAGIVITILGSIGLADRFGGTEELTKVVDATVQLIGILMAIYGNFKAHKKIEMLGAKVKSLGGSIK